MTESPFQLLLTNSDDGGGGHEDHSGTVIYVIFLAVLITFIFVGAYMESKHFAFGHETGVIILIGMVVSYCCFQVNPEKYLFQFNTQIFFHLLLPMILFAAGFNMRREEFFKNIVNIAKFGIFGSLFTWFLFVGMFWLLFEYVDMGETLVADPHDATKTYMTQFKPELIEIMVFCSILVSSDIIAAMSILKFEEQPHIFSIILGEGLFNDVVVITLYKTTDDYLNAHVTGEDKTFGAKEIGIILGNFVKLCLISVLIGVAVGFVITYLLKSFRYISHSAIHETFLLVACAMLTYFISELLLQSGITSLVSCALVFAHYSWYNLSPQGKHVSSISFQTFGFAAEAFVFSYIGLSVMFYKDYPYSWKFILAGFLIVVIGRYTSIVASYYMFACCKGSQNNYLNIKEISFATYAAFIRGAIAFGLVENLGESTFKFKKVIVSSTLVLVISSTIIFGSFTPLVQKILLPSKDKSAQREFEVSKSMINESEASSPKDSISIDIKAEQENQFDDVVSLRANNIKVKKHNQDHKIALNARKDGLKNTNEQTFYQKQEEVKEQKKVRIATEITQYVDFKHPNAQSVANDPNYNDSDDEVDDKKRGCQYYFKMFDETILRPILIYKYHRYKTKAEIDFNVVLRETNSRQTEINAFAYQQNLSVFTGFSYRQSNVSSASKVIGNYGFQSTHIDNMGPLHSPVFSVVNNDNDISNTQKVQNKQQQQLVSHQEKVQFDTRLSDNSGSNRMKSQITEVIEEVPGDLITESQQQSSLENENNQKILLSSDRQEKEGNNTTIETKSKQISMNFD